MADLRAVEFNAYARLTQQNNLNHKSNNTQAVIHLEALHACLCHSDKNCVKYVYLFSYHIKTRMGSRMYRLAGNVHDTPVRVMDEERYFFAFSFRVLNLIRPEVTDKIFKVLLTLPVLNGILLFGKVDHIKAVIAAETVH